MDQTSSPAISRKSSIVERLNFSKRPSNEQIDSSVPTVFAPEEYEMGSPIGYGSSAIVYLAKYKPLNKYVAIKLIDLDMFERNQIDELRREIQIMTLSKHPNLLPVYGSFVHTHKLYIVTPFLSAGSCLDIMKTAYPYGFEEFVIATILKQALQGLEYLHKNGLIHRDVKSGNLLVDDNGNVQLADFGVSNSLMEAGERGGVRKTFVGTPCWMAPEVMEQSGYDYKADIWSFGITSIELATGHAPFAKYPPMKVLMMTLQNEPPTLDREHTKHKYSKTFKEMIDFCLQKDPAKRPTAEKLLLHPFFKQAKKNNYLVSTILSGLPPITQRSHNRKNMHRPQSSGETPEGESWDFEGTESKNEESSSLEQSLVSLETKEEQSLEKSLPKKSRFILEDRSPSASGSTAPSSRQVSQAPPPTVSAAPSLTSSVPIVPSPSTTVPTAASPPLEVKKGRFTVNESNLNASSASLHTPTYNELSISTASGITPKSHELSISPFEITRLDSQEKKGRFEVSMPTLGPSSSTGPAQMAVDTSNSALPRNPTLTHKPSRFTVMSEGPLNSSMNGGESRKPRFEVGDHSLDQSSSNTSPQASVQRNSASSAALNVDRIVALQNQVELQGHVIYELFLILQKLGADPEEIKRLKTLLHQSPLNKQ